MSLMYGEALTVISGAEGSCTFMMKSWTNYGLSVDEDVVLEADLCVDD